jgi:hypothetical protein
MTPANVPLINAVGYLRCSGDSQEEASIPDQQKYVGHYAVEKGYRIIRWYIEVIPQAANIGTASKVWKLWVNSESIAA